MPVSAEQNAEIQKIIEALRSVSIQVVTIREALEEDEGYDEDENYNAISAAETDLDNVIGSLENVE